MEPKTLIDPNLLQLSAQQLTLLSPYLVVFGGICLAILVSVMPGLNPKWSVPGLIIASFLGGIAAAIHCAGLPAETLFGGMLLSDGLAGYANVLFLGAALLVCLYSFRYLERQGLALPEYYILLALSALGMMLMASSLNLIIIFIALELMSIAVYVLVGFRRNDRRSNEAGVKYYILGSAASAVLLYGAALLYGATLSVDIREIAQRVAQSGQLFNPMLLIGLLCVLVGFLFKIASVPFHMWMPDVYEGAPTPITGFMTTGIKAASFAAFVRVKQALRNARSSPIESRIGCPARPAGFVAIAIGSVARATHAPPRPVASVPSSGYSRTFEAKAVLCTGLFDDLNDRLEDYDGLLDEMKQRGLSMICANPDLVVVHRGRLAICAGSPIRAVTSSTACWPR